MNGFALDLRRIWNTVAHAWDMRPMLYIKTEHQDGIPVLTRYVLLDTKWQFLALHHILETAQLDAAHDHSAPYLSAILAGGYDEALWEPADRTAPQDPSNRNRAADVAGRVPDRVEVRRAGNIRCRDHRLIHHLQRVLPGTWTLVASLAPRLVEKTQE